MTEVKEIEIICEKSGLTFTAPNRRKKIHPRISYYTSNKDSEYRNFARDIIDRGKKEGWSNLEKFEQEIEKAWGNRNNPEPIEEENQNIWTGNSLAKITGADKDYRFKRDFVTPIKKEYRKSAKCYSRVFDLSTLKSGIYEFQQKSAKGNNSRWYIEYQEDGETRELSLEEVEALFPLEVAKKAISLSDSVCELCRVREGFVRQGGIILCCDCCN